MKVVLLFLIELIFVLIFLKPSAPLDIDFWDTL